MCKGALGGVMTENEPLVSIIVPVYNASSYLRECLDSILASTLSPIEIIAVDDGSTDASPDILEEYASRITVIHQPNYGPSKARNTGLDAACGEYIGFVDSDDWIEPKMYETMYHAAKENNADIVMCGILRNEDTQTKCAIQSKIYHYNDIEKEIFSRLVCAVSPRGRHQTLRGSVWCRLFRRQHIIDNNIHFCEAINNNEDMLFCVQATLKAKSYVCLGDQYLYHNRATQGTLTRRYQPKMWERQQKLLQELTDAVRICDFDFSAQIDMKVFQIAQYSIFFDMAEGTPLSYCQQISRISQISHAEKFCNALKKIKLAHLRPIERLICFSFRLHLYRVVHWLIAYRSSKR